MKLYMEHYQKPLHSDVRVAKTKWCVLRYPSNSMAQLANMPTEAFEDFYFNVCNLDYAKMSKAMDNLVDYMAKTDKVRLVAKDTDLTFSIKGLPPRKCAGQRNIPDGEVFSAPIKDSVNGYIFVPGTTFFEFIQYKILFPGIDQKFCMFNELPAGNLPILYSSKIDPSIQTITHNISIKEDSITIVIDTLWQ